MDKECTECGSTLYGKDLRHRSGMCSACRADRDRSKSRRDQRRNSMKRRLNPLGDDQAQ